MEQVVNSLSRSDIFKLAFAFAVTGKVKTERGKTTAGEIFGKSKEEGVVFVNA